MIIIFNPAAGRRRAQLLWSVLDVMAANGLKLEVRETERAGDATRLAREAADRGVKLIVAAGGDGTIGEVANGLQGRGHCRLGIIPLGTANVLAHELGLPFAPKAVAAALAFGRTRTLWPGMAEAAGQTRLFVQMFGVGFDAQVVHNLPRQLKRVTGRTAYVLQSFRELTRYSFSPIRVRVDGVEHEAGSVIVSKGRFYAGAYTLAPGRSPTDHGFTVAVFPCGGAWSVLAYGAALTLDRMGRLEKLQLLSAETVEIMSADIPAQADGEIAGCGPITVTEAAEPISIVVA